MTNIDIFDIINEIGIIDEYTSAAKTMIAEMDECRDDRRRYIDYSTAADAILDKIISMLNKLIEDVRTSEAEHGANVNT